jgi:hypothetical protein
MTREDGNGNGGSTVLGFGIGLVAGAILGVGACHLTLTVDERLGRRAAADVRTLAASLERSLRGVAVGLTARVGDRSWHSDEQLSDAVVSRLPSGPFRSAAG